MEFKLYKKQTFRTMKYITILVLIILLILCIFMLNINFSNKSKISFTSIIVINLIITYLLMFFILTSQTILSFIYRVETYKELETQKIVFQKHKICNWTFLIYIVMGFLVFWSSLVGINSLENDFLKTLTKYWSFGIFNMLLFIALFTFTTWINFLFLKKYIKFN